jgi:predicted transposase/invertase (TIGR01784 family)
MNAESDKIRLMSPKIDFAFKLIFGDSRHKEIPMAFLSAVLKLPRESLVDIEIINSELLREYQEDKKGILDVRVVMRDGRQVNIEIQILPTEFMPERTLYYWSKMYATQIHAGEGYDVLKPCITINIVDFDCTPLNQVHSCYHLTEDRTGHHLTDVLEVHFLELPKLFEKDVDVNPDDETVQWMMFIDSQSREVMEMLAARNHDIGNAFDLLQIISKDEKARMAYEAREAELMDQRTRIKSAFTKGEEIGIKKGEELGIKKGIDEGKAEIIRALLAGGMQAEVVSAISGMDITRVIEIQKGMPGTSR